MNPFNPNQPPQGMGFNPNFNPPIPGNFPPLNPNPQPMAQNNQLGAFQLLAAQLQSNPLLQMNLLNQNLAAGFGGMPFMMGPNSGMMPNAQFGFPQQQMLPGFGQNPMYGGFPRGAILNPPQMPPGSMNNQWRPPNLPQASGSERFQDNSHMNARNPVPQGFGRNFEARNEMSHNRFQRPAHNARGPQRNRQQPSRRGGREGNWKKQKPHAVDLGDIAPSRKFPVPNYPEKEIRQWREARRKNHISHKMKGKADKRNEAAESRLRRQQLKEVLAKQAELGVEVAEVPASYLREHQEQSSFKNKRGGRGCGRGDSHLKKQKFDNERPEVSPAPVKREPSLLEKLLAPEIRRDKSRLLQAFRFMVLNDFFKHLPDKPLVFPEVTVKEGWCDDGSQKAVKEIENEFDDDDDEESSEEEEGELVD